MTGPEATFLDHLRQGRFVIQRVVRTGEHVFYPRQLPEAWEWVEASGAATVYSRTIVRQRPERGGDYCIALVELAEGPRMMSRIVGAPPDAVRIGMAVTAEVGPASWGGTDGPVIAFRATDPAGGAP